jgi:hypothetical protein
MFCSVCLQSNRVEYCNILRYCCIFALNTDTALLIMDNNRMLSRTICVSVGSANNRKLQT